MIWLYRLLFLPALGFMLPYYLLRMWKRGGYSRDFRHRLGLFRPLPPKKPGVRRLWLQAVSVGEINAITPLLQKLHADPKLEIVLTTTTSTGYAIAREKLSPLTLATGIFPLDFWLCNWLAWRRIQPDLIVLMEGELWPEHLHRSRRKNIPAFLINARLSDRSFRRYQKLQTLARPLLATLQAIGASSSEDAQRFHALGVPKEKITVTGNLKFDVGGGEIPSTAHQEALLEKLGLADPIEGEKPLVLLGSSTWPGEEKLLLDVLREARQQSLPLRLLIVPRHAERRQEISALLSASPWKWFLRSQHPFAPFTADICLADTTGELRDLTAVANLAFVGKSLPPHEGGQTPVECAALGVPVVYGPHMSNFRAICQGLENASAAIRVTSSEQAKETLLHLLADPQSRLVQGNNALAWHTHNRGATQRTLALLSTIAH